jgi:hypothetical protein
MSARSAWVIVLCTPLMGALGAVLGIGARMLITRTLSDAGIQLSTPGPDWAMGSDALVVLAVAGASPLAGLTVRWSGRAGGRGFTVRRFASAAGSAVLGASFGMAAAGAHVARFAVPATLAAEVNATATALDLAALSLPAWAAFGVVGGLIIYGAMSTITGLLEPES